MILTHRNRPEKYEVIYIRDNKEIHTGIINNNLDLLECKMWVRSVKTNEEMEAYGWWFKEIN